MVQGFEASLKLTSPNNLPLSLEIGYFVFLEKLSELKFQDAQQKLYEINRISLLTQEFDIDNGYKNLPKPYLIGENNEIKEYGANCLYSYVDASHQNIVIFGALMNPLMNNKDKKLNFDINDYNNLNEKALARNNDSRYFTVIEDAQGNLILVLKGKNKNGNVQIAIRGDDSQNNGNFTFTLNGKANIIQVDDSGKELNKIFLDNTDGKELIRISNKYNNKYEANKDGTIVEADKMRLGNSSETVGKIFTDLVQYIRQMTQPTAAGGPTIQTKFNDGDFQSLLQRISDFFDNQ